jgi:HK97 family phage prohead protease
MISNDPRQARAQIHAVSSGPIVKKAHGIITKAPTDSKRTGWFQGYLATWDVDRDNERFAQGAFAEDIMSWKQLGSGPPVAWSHMHSAHPGNLLGKVLTMTEDDNGLLIEGQLDMSVPEAVRVADLLYSGTLSTMSVGFSASEWAFDPGDVRVFTKARVIEASLTPVPANPYAVILASKTTTTAGSNASVRFDVSPAYDPRHDPAHWREKIEQLGSYVKSGEMSEDAAAFVRAAQAAYREERRAEADQHDLWVVNSLRAQAMRGVSFEEEVEQDRKERAAWIADRNIVEGETVRVEIAPEAPESRTRLTSDEMMPDD